MSWVVPELRDGGISGDQTEQIVATKGVTARLEVYAPGGKRDRRSVQHEAMRLEELGNSK